MRRLRLQTKPVKKKKVKVKVKNKRTNKHFKNIRGLSLARVPSNRYIMN